MSICSSFLHVQFLYLTFTAVILLFLSSLLLFQIYFVTTTIRFYSPPLTCASSRHTITNFSQQAPPTLVLFSLSRSPFYPTPPHSPNNKIHSASNFSQFQEKPLVWNIDSISRFTDSACSAEYFKYYFPPIKNFTIYFASNAKKIQLESAHNWLQLPQTYWIAF